MPHDKNGVELKLGDIVTIRAKVTALTLNEHWCNCSVELVEPMRTPEHTEQKVAFSQLNTRQVEKEEP